VQFRARIDDRPHANSAVQQASRCGVEPIMVAKQHDVFADAHSVAHEITLPGAHQHNAGTIVIRESNGTLGGPHGNDE